MNEIKWISCKEALPEQAGQYLVTTTDMYDQRVVREYPFELDRKRFDYSDISTKKVIAWAELPKPYKSN